jgi:ATP-dependent Clp protease ATP-binding subunit ClpA
MDDMTAMGVPPTAVRAVRGGDNPLDELSRYLRASVFGQDGAIDSIVRGLNRARYGFAAGRNQRPVAVLLFLGPTGVGKTETARRLAHYLHPDGDGFLKIDCSLFSQGHEIAALVGAPPAYVGRDQRPLFDAEVIETPNSVVLFDEIEKASAEFRHLMLQIMEDGEVTLLNGGRRVDFHQSIIIMTSNVGAREMMDFIQGRRLGFHADRDSVARMGETIHSIGLRKLHQAFTPEWLNRIDEIVAFRPLGCDTLAAILDRMLGEANEQYLRHGLRVRLTARARDALLSDGYVPEFGARPLRSRLMQEVEAPLADLLASGGVPEGCDVWVDSAEGPGSRSDLAFFYAPNDTLLAVAREYRLREAERPELSLEQAMAVAR